MMKKLPVKSLGFTLIELLVVVSIIALLVSILLPALGKAREQAKMAVCGSDNRQIVIASTLYAEDNSQYLPGTTSVGQASMDTAYAGVNALSGAALLVDGEYASPELFYSPSDKRTFEANNYDYDAEKDTYGWAARPLEPSSGKRYVIGWSFDFRRPGKEGAAFSGFQQVNPKAGGYQRPFKVDDVKAFIADRFSYNYVWSFHGGKEELAKGPVFGNGLGWHVGYTDGHVAFQRNYETVYVFNSPVNAAGGWTNQHWNWYYWDIHQ